MMKPLYTSRELKTMVRACNTQKELDKLRFIVTSLTVKEIPFEIMQKFNASYMLKHIDIKEKSRR